MAVYSRLFFNFTGIELNKPTHFTVNTKGAGKAKLDAQFTGPTKGEAVRDFEVINNHDNTHTVKYTPVQQVKTCYRLWACRKEKCIKTECICVSQSCYILK